MNRLIELTGSAPVAPLLFRSATLVEVLSDSATASVVCESDQADLNPDDYLGQTLCIGFETRSGALRYFDGVIAQMQVGANTSQGRCSVQFELKSWTWLLSRNQDFRIYQNKSVAQIVQEVVGRHSHPAIRLRDETTQANRVWEYCVQYGESDLNFMRRLLEQEGVYFWFEHAEQSHTLVLVDAFTAHTPFEAYEELQVDSAARSGRLLNDEVIDQWTLRQSIEPHRHAHADYNFKTPSVRLNEAHDAEVEAHSAPYEVFEYPGEFETPALGQQYGLLRQQEQTTRAKTFTGNTDARGVCAGRSLSVVCADNPALSRTVLVTRTHIGLTEAPPEAQTGGRSSFHCDFEAVDLAVPYRPPRLSRKPQVKGPLPALVVGPEGQEIHTDEYGRVKVQFYWDRVGNNNDSSSCWIRVAYPAAGKGWGMVAVPRIGQEVCVAFEDGDPDRPLITGVVYNANQPVPYPLPEQKTVSGWRTRSSMGGADTQFNELRFDDLTGSEYVWFQAEKDYMALVKQRSQVEIGADSHQLVHGSLIEEIRRDVSRQVLGAVMAHIGKALNLKVDDDCLAAIGGSLGLETKGDWMVRTQANASLDAVGQAHLRAASQLSCSAGTVLNLQGGAAVKVSGNGSVSLVSGGSSILVSPGGVFINGPTVSINSGGGGSAASAANPSTPSAPSQPEAVSPPVDPLA